MAIEQRLSMPHQDNPESDPEEVPDGHPDHSSDASSDVVELDNAEFPDYFQERNGRLFHSHVVSPYPLPVDTAEQDRANRQHIFFQHLLGANYVGPVQEVLQFTVGEQRKTLDLATGTGKWVLDMSRDFPHVKFYGLDIVPIATRTPPRNVQFEMHDIGTALRFKEGTFDFVHGRSISMAVHDYGRLLREVGRVLRPQGLLLACELGPSVTSAPGYPGDPAILFPKATTFFQVLNACLEQRGIQPMGPYLLDHIRHARCFTGIQSRVYRIPVGDWDENLHRQELGREFREILLAYANAMKDTIGPEMNQYVDELFDGLKEEVHNAQGMVLEYYTVFARKI